MGEGGEGREKGRGRGGEGRRRGREGGGGKEGEGIEGCDGNWGGGGGGESKRRQMGYLYTVAVVLIKGIHVLVTFSLIWGIKS